MPHRDDVARFATLRPDHNHRPAVELTGGDETGFAAIEPLIDDGRSKTGKDFIGPREIQPATSEREIALDRIEGNPQIIVPPINVKLGGLIPAR